jgi:hypothetical protein
MPLARRDASASEISRSALFMIHPPSDKNS